MTRIGAVVSGTLILVALGCATPFVPAQPENQSWADPAEGTVATAYVGDPFLALGRAEQKRTIALSAGVSYGGYVIAPGEYLVTAMTERGV